MRSQIGNRNSKILIVGAGPAGSSLAVRLANDGCEVTLIERETFPRHKLCGEFISPECLSHFAQIGALEGMLAAGGERIYETRFYDRKERSFPVPSSLLDESGFALSLSRSEMDRQLLERARTVGVSVYEGTKVSDVAVDGERITGLAIIGENNIDEFINADLFVDATGRSLALSRLVARKRSSHARTMATQSLAVGFKTHLAGVQIPRGTCEIFAFPGGYGGLTTVEDGLANLCFIMDPRVARKFGANADELVEKAVRRNRRAARALENARPVRDWLAVSISSFGRSAPAAATNLFTVGDAAAFIDPFTGSGMLMALESSSLLAAVIKSERHTAEAIQKNYQASYDKLFGRRLRVCSLLRRAASLPLFPTLAVSFLNASKRSRNYLAGSTRPAGPVNSKIS